MTPRVQVIALDVQATAEDVANATRATGLSRFPVYREQPRRGRRHRAHQGRAGGARPSDGRATRSSELMREPLLVPGVAHRATGCWTGCSGERTHGRRHRRVRRHGRRGHPGGHRRGGRRRGPRRARPARDARPGPGRHGRGRPRRSTTPTAPPAPTSWRAIGLRAPEGPYETLAGLVADRARPHPGRGRHASRSPGWRLDVVDASGRRAARVLLHAPPPGPGRRTGTTGRRRGR